MKKGKRLSPLSKGVFMLSKEILLTLSILFNQYKKKINISVIALNQNLTDNMKKDITLNHLTTEFEKSKIEKAFDDSKRIIEEYQRRNIHIITPEEKEYPENLKMIPDHPPFLIAQGNLNLLNHKKQISVIGTRKPEQCNLKNCEKYIQYLIENKYNIISGLALGCDTIAHSLTIKNKGLTTAILPSSIMNIIPKENSKLATAIISNNGLILSEYILVDEPQKFHFIERDKIISGISNGILVLETKIKGGTIQTLKHAQNQKKKISCLNLESNQFLIQNKVATKIETVKDLENFINEIEKQKSFEKLNQSTQQNLFGV